MNSTCSARSNRIGDAVPVSAPPGRSRITLRWLVAAGTLLIAAFAGVARAQSAPAVAPSASRAAVSRPHATAVVQPKARRAWQDALLAHPASAPGCFEAHFPDKDWKPVPCVTVPPVPKPVRLPGSKLGSEHPLQIGGGTQGGISDYAITVPGAQHLTSATGAFANVSGIRTISSSAGSNGFFTLQLNSDTFANTPANPVPTCSGASTPADCVGWQQFVYTDGDDGDHGRLYIQYWMINHGSADCPPSWQTSDQSPGDCFFNSPAASIPNPAFSTFGQLVLKGATTAGGQSQVTLTTAGGLYQTNAYDNVLNLSTHWGSAEFNVLGAGNSSEANFNDGVSMEVQLSASVSPPSPLACITRNTTAESANLFIQTGCTVNAAGNAIQFTEGSGPYAQGPLVQGVTPGSVAATGGDLVTISGLRFASTDTVTFGSTPVPIQSVAPSAIVVAAAACSPLGCEAPGAFVTVSAALGPAGAQRTVSSSAGPIMQTPKVLTVSPSSGPQLTRIVVTGAGFSNSGPNPVFYVGNAPATNVSCAPATVNTQCSMTVPAQSGPSPAPISFGGPGGLSAASFTYAGSALPVVASITPNHGPQTGGTQVTITGTNFTQTMEAGFNGNYIGITNDCPSTTQCTFQTPRGLGQETVGLIDYSTGLASPAGSGPVFTYDVPPPSGSFLPTGGLVAGGTAVTANLVSVDANAGIAIQFNFSTGAVGVGDAICKPAPANAANAYCTFASPPLPAGIAAPAAVPVTATSAGVTVQLGNFSYVEPPSGSIFPYSSYRAGGATVTIHVNNLLAGAGAVVDFDFNGVQTAAANAACTVDAGNTGDSTCTATVPPLPADEKTPIKIPVSVTAQGQTVVIGNFDYVSPVVSPCAACLAQGGVCSTVGGKFVCTCQKSSPTGNCQ